MADKVYNSKEEVFAVASTTLGKSLREFIPAEDIGRIESMLEQYGNKRKGYLGDLVEKYIFGIDNNGRPEADFLIAGVELKTTPLKKHAKNQFASKERLVFSMIDYDKVVHEVWETCSFLQKNSLLLLMFYLHVKEQLIIDYEFRFVHLLNLLTDISVQDVAQIKKDWEFIVAKIRRGEAHLLSEGDTYYLGACTKAKNSSVVRDQPMARIPAKPRAFSLKQKYLDYIIQKNLLHHDVEADSIYEDTNIVATVDEVIASRFSKYIGKTGAEISAMLGRSSISRPKNYNRILANSILTGKNAKKIEELEKANVTLRVIELEPNGKLVESIQFSAFDYNDLVTQVWYDEGDEDNDPIMSDFHEQLEMKKFLFVVFQRIDGSKEVKLKKIKFWNFPMSDIDKARKVWDETVDLIRQGKIVKEIKTFNSGKTRRYTYFPGTTFNGVAHVRPHGENSSDVSKLPVNDQLTGASSYTKHCFWLNAEYVQKAIES